MFGNMGWGYGNWSQVGSNLGSHPGSALRELCNLSELLSLYLRWVIIHVHTCTQVGCPDD